MTEPELSDHVMIRCPACGASESADPAVLADAPMIVCRNCGETWPVGRRRAPRPAFSTTGTHAHPGTALIEAERRPLITFSDGAEKAWAAKIEGDILPDLEPPPRSRLASIGAALGGVAAIGFVGASIAGREAAVAALPDLAGLYEAVGLPVNIDGLAIEEVEAERGTGDAGPTVIVRGKIRNLDDEGQPARALVIDVRDALAERAASRDFNPPPTIIAAGEAAPFVLELDNPPENASDIVIRFRRASEPIPDEPAVQ